MKFDTVQQLIRIAAYTGGGALLGDAVTNGAEFQGAVGGAVSVASFVWWFFWERKRS